MPSATNHANRSICLILAAAAALGLSGCGEAPQPANDTASVQPANAATETVLPVPLPVPLPDLTRRDLIAAAAAAADAVAAGTPVPAASAGLLGRRFAIRLPFGCEGPQPAEAAWASWNVNPDSGALKLSARSELAADDPWLRAIAAVTPFEAVEGFWIRRPWTSAETCPPPTAGSPAAAEPETLALVELFGADASRTRQRGGRPYTATVKLDGKDASAPHRYRLLLEGRVEGFSDRQPVHCAQETPGNRPRCAIAVEFTRVAFESMADASIAAEWRY